MVSNYPGQNIAIVGVSSKWGSQLGGGPGAGPPSAAVLRWPPPLLRLVALEEQRGRQNFYAAVHAKVLQVWVTRDDDAGSRVDGQSDEFIVCRVSADGHFGRYLEALDGLGTFD